MTEARTSLMVSELDLNKATALIHEVIRRNNPDVEEEVLSKYKAQPMAVVNGKDGIAVICTEGVGWVTDKDGLLPVHFWYQDWQQNYFDVTPEEVLSCLSDEQIDLAEFIRVHNDRLENNFYIWYSYAKSYDQNLKGLQVS